MTEKAQPQGYFVQDPFTDEVKGPLSVVDLKRWFAKGGVEGWGVSKSPNGPWTLAAQVKGLPPPKAADEASTIQSASKPPEDFSPLDDDSTPTIREHVGNVVDVAKQYLPKKASDFAINPTLQFLILGVIGLAIYTYVNRDTVARPLPSPSGAIAGSTDLSALVSELQKSVGASYEEDLWITTHDLEPLCDNTFDMAVVNAGETRLRLEIMQIGQTVGSISAQSDLAALTFLLKQGFVKCKARVTTSLISANDTTLSLTANTEITSVTVVKPDEKLSPLLQKCGQACVGVKSQMPLKLPITLNNGQWVFSSGSYERETVNALNVKRHIRTAASGLSSLQILNLWKRITP